MAAQDSPLASNGKLLTMSLGKKSTSFVTLTKGTPARLWTALSLRETPTVSLRECSSAAMPLAAAHGVVYIRAEYPIAVERLQAALEMAREEWPAGERYLRLWLLTLTSKFGLAQVLSSVVRKLR